MEEKNYKNVTLFIFETLIIQHRKFINQELIDQINKFIYEYYKDYKDLFSVLFNEEEINKFKEIFDMDPIDLYIENNQEFITMEDLFLLLLDYRNAEGYIALVDEVGYEKDSQINDLVLLFADYCKKQLLNYSEYQTFLPKGYPRILH